MTKIRVQLRSLNRSSVSIMQEEFSLYRVHDVAIRLLHPRHKLVSGMRNGDRRGLRANFSMAFLERLPGSGFFRAQ